MISLDFFRRCDRFGAQHSGWLHYVRKDGSRWYLVGWNMAIYNQ